MTAVCNDKKLWFFFRSFVPVCAPPQQRQTMTRSRVEATETSARTKIYDYRVCSATIAAIDLDHNNQTDVCCSSLCQHSNNIADGAQPALLKQHHHILGKITHSHFWHLATQRLKCIDDLPTFYA